VDNTWSTTTMSPYDATVSSPDSVENRLTALERQVAHLREQNALIASDASAARTLAAGADRDVSEVRAELRAHTQVLNSLRETQLEQGQVLVEHGQLLAEQGQLLAEHGQLLAGQKQVLAEQKQVLAEHGQVLAEHGQVLAEQGQLLVGQKQVLTEHGQLLVGQKQVLTEQGQTMRAGFAGVNAGMEQIVALLDRITSPDAD